MKWSEGQQRVLHAYETGNNIFITGPGGSGKTTLIRQLYKNALDQQKKMQVTALTGCAAILLGCKARTIHSFAGIGLGTGTIEEVVGKVAGNNKKARAWRSIDILVIDEVSMMSKKLLEMLDAVARACRRRPGDPFGGLQVIFSGDFYQIRPIGNEKEPDASAFCFESPLWSTLFRPEHQISLEKIFRQSDPSYASLLNKIRNGTLDEDGLGVLRQHIGKPVPVDRFFRPTKLFATRRQAEEVNRQELEKLPKEREQTYTTENIDDLPMTTKEYETRQRFSAAEVEHEYAFLRRNLMCEDTFRLRVGCQVMCVVNKQVLESKYLCNGSQGVVIGFTDSFYPIVRFQNGLEVIMEPHVWASETIPGIGIRQIPLILAWAVTIHKAQGASMETAEVDAGSSIFECGQTYVALSRIRSLDGLFLTSFDPASVYVCPRVRDFYARMKP
jgi:ATP-dependent DNA helicase PIF1